MKVVAFLPAKGSSNRIRSKNIRFLDGKPLFLHTLEKLIEAKFINEVYLDTESEDIINLADAIDCNIMKRDPKLASNKTDGNILFMNEVKSVDADIYIQILCTSPFIELGTIEKAVNILADGSEHDSCVLIREERLYKWVGGKPQYDIQNIPT